MSPRTLHKNKYTWELTLVMTGSHGVFDSLDMPTTIRISPCGILAFLGFMFMAHLSSNLDSIWYKVTKTKAGNLLGLDFMAKYRLTYY